MAVQGPVRRWKGFGKPQRAELYFRWSLYMVAWCIVPVNLVLSASSVTNIDRSVDAVRVTVVVSLASTLLCLRAFRTSLDHYLHRPTEHLRWLIVNSALSVAGSWAVLLLGPSSAEPGRPGGTPFTAAIAIAMLCAAIGPISVGLPLRQVFAAGLGLILLIAPAMLLAGMSPATTAGLAVGAAISLTFLVGTCRSFAWVTAIIWELETAREAQSRLAVAEERLRFSRDLHDVMGRNLTTIALKSELAVQFARRGARRPPTRWPRCSGSPRSRNARSGTSSAATAPPTCTPRRSAPARCCAAPTSPARSTSARTPTNCRRRSSRCSAG